MKDDLTYAIDVVEAVHWAMDWDVWGKRRLKYWSSFEEHIKAAATATATPSRFLSELCSLMKVPSLARIPASAGQVAAAVQYADHRALMRALRDEAPYIVVMVRQRSEARKEAKAKLNNEFEEAGL